MKIFAIIFTCLIGTFHPLKAIPSPSMLQEYETAIEISKKVQKGTLSKEQAIATLLSTFSDYSHADGKLATFAQFIHKTTGIETPIIHASPEQRGWSGSEVFSVQTDETKSPCFFLKVFPYDSKHYLPEIFGLSFMRDVKEVDSPKIYVCGQCLVNENRFFLILETPVNGISLQQYFLRVGQHSLDTPERKQAFTELCEATHACGVGLAKFHHSLPQKKQSLPKDAEEAMKLDLNSAIEELTYQRNEQIDSEKLRAYADSVLQKMKIEEHLIGVAYDDIKTIHTFYDHLTGKFALVNPDRLHLSFDSDGEVQGLLIKDVCKYLLSLRLNRFQYVLNENQKVVRKELLTEEEASIIKSIFESGYLQGGGVLPNPLEKEYIFLQQDLFFIKNSRRSFPEPELTRVKDLITISIENIESLLKSN